LDLYHSTSHGRFPCISLWCRLLIQYDCYNNCFMTCPHKIIYNYSFSHNELHTNHDNMKVLKWNSKGFGSANSIWSTRSSKGMQLSEYATLVQYYNSRLLLYLQKNPTDQVLSNTFKNFIEQIFDQWCTIKLMHYRISGTMVRNR